MSDVDISPEAAKWALDLRCRVVAYKTDIDIAQFIERQDTELTATQEKLAAAVSASRLLRMRVIKLLEECDKRVGYRSEYKYTIPWGEALLLREAVNAFDNGDVSELTTALEAARERDLRLVSFAARIGNSEGYWATADTEILAAFNTQDNSNE